MLDVMAVSLCCQWHFSAHEQVFIELMEFIVTSIVVLYFKGNELQCNLLNGSH